MREVALSQSFQAAHTHDPPWVVVMLVDGAPLAPPAAPVAPFAAVLAPLKATTYAPEFRVAVTITPLRVVGATACQISAVPASVLLRTRSVQASPPPATPEKLWLPAATGPSDMRNANRTSLAVWVESDGDVIDVAGTD
jgi:hypothetical protein